MSLHNLISNGGKVLIVGGMPKNWQEYRNHPQLIFWSGEAGEINSIVKVKMKSGLPVNTRAVIMSRFNTHAAFEMIYPEVKKKRLTYFPQQNDGQIRKLLDEITTDNGRAYVDNSGGKLVKKEQPVSTEQKKEETTTMTPTDSTNNVELRHAAKGEVLALIKEFDDKSLTVTDSAKEIHKITTAKGLRSTKSSLIVGISKYRRDNDDKPKVAKTSRTKKEKKQTEEVIKNVASNERIDSLIQAFDDAIAGLQLAREAAVKISQENEELRAMRDRVSKLLTGL